ncbi:unnamed protein product [Somion occarium]|uniref:Uncharacterized protein n=1 Tax=Somion occarium TaxID=3059160 RepID=A0ABP1DKU9_9APHY
MLPKSTRFLISALLSVGIARVFARLIPLTEDGSILAERDGIISGLSPTSISSIFGDPTHTLSEKLAMVDSLLKEAGLTDTVDKTALSEALLHGTGLSMDSLNENALTNSLLNTTGLATLQNILQSRTVYIPKITHPKSETVWVTRSKVTVKWETHNPPKKITNQTGKIVLGYLEDGTDEHFDLDNPLADDFDIMDGSIDVYVPDVEPRDNYFLALFCGDSGNRSPTFTIN